MGRNMLKYYRIYEGEKTEITDIKLDEGQQLISAYNSYNKDNSKPLIEFFCERNSTDGKLLYLMVIDLGEATNHYKEVVMLSCDENIINRIYIKQENFKGLRDAFALLITDNNLEKL